MVKIQLQEFYLPDFWASALINNDYSGLEEREEKQLNEFINYWKDDLVINSADAPADKDGYIKRHFLKYHDATDLGVLACDCFTYTFEIRSTSSLSPS